MIETIEASDQKPPSISVNKRTKCSVLTLPSAWLECIYPITGGYELVLKCDQMRAESH